MMPRLVRRKLGRPRRGALYLHVMCVSLIVSSLGLAGLSATRVQRRMRQGDENLAQARLHAQTALQTALQLVTDDPDWRTRYPNGMWKTNIPVGTGTYSIQGIDPSDGDLTGELGHPVTLTGIGKQGTATHKMQITLVPETQGVTALQAAIHCGRDFDAKSGATIHCDQLVSANNNMKATTAVINSDVQAVAAISGGTYNGNQKAGVTARTMPDETKLLEYYLANGTTISYTSLDVGYPNLLRNTGFESGVGEWTAVASAIQSSSAFATGTKSLRVISRTSAASGVEQDVTDLIQSDGAYTASVAAAVASVDKVGVLLQLKVVSTGSGTQYFSTPHKDIKDVNGFKTVDGSLTPTWTGNLVSASLIVRTKDGDPVTSFSIDDVVLKETNTDRTIFRKLLSPASNPFGPTTNSKGIYIIDCDDKMIEIKQSRIVGTLVLIRPRAGSQIGAGGPISWEPADPSLPSLIVTEKEITINPSYTGLNERVNMVNFNPASTPFAGVSDADQADIYVSRFKGLFYCAKKIKLANAPLVQGVLVAGENIEVSGTLTSNYDSRFFLNPPPGFRTSETIRVLLESAKKPLN